MINSDNLKEINKIIQSLIKNGILNKNIGNADIPVPITIESYNGSKGLTRNLLHIKILLNAQLINLKSLIYKRRNTAYVVFYR